MQAVDEALIKLFNPESRGLQLATDGAPPLSKGSFLAADDAALGAKAPTPRNPGQSGNPLQHSVLEKSPLGNNAENLGVKADDALQTADDSAKLKNGRGDQSALSNEAEQIVSDFTGIPRNIGPNTQKVPGIGVDFREPDLQFRGQQGSVRSRGTIVEVKAANEEGLPFGKLSGRSRDQILDFVDVAQRYRDKSSLVNDPATKELLKNVKVEVFSDFKSPTSGKFDRLIQDGILDIKPIPR
ncbi:MAG: hypothetical protein HC936_07785 [Leptolyngbyaceae cyanobacterium SU_3_3]|nr:hypothetical protein [Leptolyngbyaceae cyanobacterium SU_3_3]